MPLALAWRNFALQLNRFQLILGALVVGFALLVLMLGTTNGMTEALRDKAVRYFSGDVTIFSFAADRRIADADLIAQTLRATPGLLRLCRRTEYYGGDATLYFAGASMRQRKVIGVDWSQEASRFQELDWVSGAPPAADDRKGIVVSEASARKLRLAAGDELVVVFNTVSGQRNSLDLVVRGVFRDSSFFGYASYVDLRTLNAAIGYPEDAVTVLGAVLEPGASPVSFGAALMAKLAGVVAAYPLINSRADQVEAFRRNGDGMAIGATTLDANLAQISDILNAIVAVTWLVVVLFVAILMIGVGNTYRMIIFERTPELGTMRALGMTQGRLLALLVLEAGCLGAVGAMAGTVLGGALLYASQLVDFTGNTAALLFVSDGRLKPSLPWVPYIGAVAALLAATVLGAWFPARAAAKRRPVDSLRWGE